MKLRSRLFIKIFIGFWLVSTAVLASWMLSAHYFESLLDTGALEHRRPGPPHRFMLRMIYQLQNADDAEIPELVNQARDEHQVDIYLLNAQGEDLLGRQVPAAVREVARELGTAKRRAFARTPTQALLAHNIYRREQGPLRAVFAFRPRGDRVLGMLGSNLWLRMGLAVVISGLLCYGLSRLMTNRLKELQLAARRLANGELDARLQARDGSGDETDELARDFNSMAQQLQERIQAQKRLLGDVSHELRSPLARLRIALALAQQDQTGAAQYLQRIEQEAERLEELIGQLLATRAQDIQLDTHIDLVPLLQQLCDDARFEGEQQDKRVSFTHAPEQAVVASSGDLLHKSFENLLRNAVSHTAPGSEVSVHLELAGGNCLIRIEDQGSGVPEEELEKIFDEFYRTDTARARDTGGYGLGLAIARRAILRHGGSIKAENTGTGLAMTAELPIEA
jgi:signal transduction histidine kinase